MGGLPKIFKIFVYQPILMKFDIRWFHALLKLNLNSFFKNSEKGGPLRGGIHKKFPNFCLSTDFDEI